MCEPMTILAVAGAASTVMTGVQAYEQGKFQEGVSEYNAAQMRNEATQTRNKGVEEENRHRQEVAQMQARQRTQLAASGVDIDSGSAAQIQRDTAIYGEVDALRIRDNFMRQADSMEDQADLTIAEGKNARKSGRNQLFSSVLGGAGQLAAGWYSPDSAAKKQLAL